VARAVSLDEPLKDGAGTTGRTRQRYSALVISEVALALVLLMGAGLLVKMVHRVASYQHSSTARLLLRSGIFLDKPADGGAINLLGKELAAIAAARTVAGVVDAAAISSASAPGGALSSEVATDTTGVITTLDYSVVTPSYVRTLGLPIVAGRDFEDGDLAGDGVVVVNSVAAARLYPHGPAVGHMLKLGAAARNAPWLRIVGVCRAVAEGPPGSEPGPDVFVVRRPAPNKRLAQVLIRTTREDPRIAAAVAAKLATVGPGIGRWVFPYLMGWEEELRSSRFVARLFAMMGAFALLLAAVGIYGVLAYSVSRRIREFAVRIAVGAERADMLKLVLHDGLVMTLAGTGLGAFLALWAMGLLGSYLEGSQILPTDVLSLVAAELVLVSVATAATLAPAFRAMRADPIEILRAT
jgi:putative ABC transport system permease protein